MEKTKSLNGTKQLWTKIDSCLWDEEILPSHAERGKGKFHNYDVVGDVPNESVV